MTRLVETRAGDINVRSGVVLKYKNYFLAEYPTPSIKYPAPLWDIPKGHVQWGENIKDAAIRECFEETGIKLRHDSLQSSIKVTYDNAPMYLFVVNVIKPIRVNQMFCASFFNDNGVQKPECCKYQWLSASKQLHWLQKGLRAPVLYYFLYPCMNYSNKVLYGGGGKMDEKIKLEEMAQLIVSSKEDGLPFVILVQIPEPKDVPPHAHIFDSKTRKEIGAFVITTTPPKTIRDLQPYKNKSGKHKGLDNISLADQEAIVKWATKRNVHDSFRNNWDTLIYEYTYNYCVY